MADAMPDDDWLRMVEEDQAQLDDCPMDEDEYVPEDAAPAGAQASPGVRDGDEDLAGPSGSAPEPRDGAPAEARGGDVRPRPGAAPGLGPDAPMEEQELANFDHEHLVATQRDQDLRFLAGDGPSLAPPEASGLSLWLRRTPQATPSRSAAAIPSQKALVTVTVESGDRVYCALDDGAAPVALADVRTVLRAEKGGRLLSRPIAELIKDAEESQLQRSQAAAEAARRAAAEVAPGTPPQRREGGSEAGDAALDDGEEPESTQGRRLACARLWVDKYSPRTFTDLLSGDAVNRGVLAWMQSWSGCVFGRKPSQAQVDLGAGVSQAAAKLADKHRGGFRAGAPPRQAPEHASLDAHGRPPHKVLLLGGPPGLGKTTLAHTVAALCGYKAVEINASDDRSATALTQRVRDAASMGSVDGDKRPACIIVDEIDGVVGSEGNSAVRALLKIVQGGGGKGEGGAEEAAGAEGGEGARRAGAGAVLRRPIICVCNDLFAPVLRPLRDVARVFKFTPPAAGRLSSRLRFVCEREGLQTEPRALSLLAEKSGCDVRTCLNTLQFLQRRGQVARVSEIRGMAFGHKDQSTTAFAVWESLTTTLRTRRHDLRGAPEAQAAQQRYNDLMGFGEHDLVLSGCFENLHRTRDADALMGRQLQALEDLTAADAFQARARRSVEFHLLAYLPAFALSYRARVAGPERIHVQWPKAETEARRRLVDHRGLLASWIPRCAPAAVQRHPLGAMALEVVPAVLLSLAPNIRPVARDLLSQPERAALASTVDTMLYLNLALAENAHPVPEALGASNTFLARTKQFAGRKRSSGGFYAAGAGGRRELCTPLALEPAIDTLHCYNGTAATARPIAPTVQQIVMAELTAERIRRSATAHGVTEGDAPPASRDGARGGQASKQAKPGMMLTLEDRIKAGGVAPAVPRSAPRPQNWLQTLQQGRAVRKRAAARESLGGEQGTPSAASARRSARAQVVYKYHEGLTNAVKWPLKMADLLAGPGGERAAKRRKA
ncbi:unnamed protein product [Pedinophyceae sp. YPF-701]|nr:unnamed protein product [Pedinophyceae sp. YPF-701]